MNKLVVAAVLALGVCGLSCAPPADREQAAGDRSAAIASEGAMKVLAARWDEANRSGDPASVTALYVADGAAAMAPDVPAVEGVEALGAYFEQSLSGGGLNVTHRMSGVLASEDTVVGYGTYSLGATDVSGRGYQEIGKWIAITQRQEDRSLLVVRNIWNRNVPPPGAIPPPAVVSIPGPEAAANAQCLDGPSELDKAFVSDFLAGNIAQLVANHTEDSSRMPPGAPPVYGRIGTAAYLQGIVNLFPQRDLALTEIEEVTAGDLGYTRGRYRFDYARADGADGIAGAGKYVAVSRKGEDGCWRHHWVIWNSDSPWERD